MRPTEEMHTFARLKAVLDPLELAVGHSFMREDIPALFGEVFNPGNWNSGHVVLVTPYFPAFALLAATVCLLTMIWYNPLIFALFLSFLALGYSYFRLTGHQRDAAAECVVQPTAG